MRTVAILATFNEERFIAGFLQHMSRQGVDVYLCDNESTDKTVATARRYLGQGLIGIETIPKTQVFDLWSILRRKEQLAATIEADWFLHVDADEIRLPPRSDQTLSHALAEADANGFNAVNFCEHTFIPTQEAPDHDHPDFQQTMRWYYPFLPFTPHRLNAWKRQPAPVELAWSAGHEVRFPGLRACPTAFPMRHYLFLSAAHAIAKYSDRAHAPRALAGGWHGWRAKLSHPAARRNPALLTLPSSAELRLYCSDDQLDWSRPRRQHDWAEWWAARVFSAGERSEANHLLGGGDRDGHFVGAAFPSAASA